MKKGREFRPMRHRKPGPLDLESAKRNIVAINQLFKSPVERAQALRMLLQKAQIKNPQSDVLFLIEKALESETKIAVGQSRKANTSFNFSDDVIGRQLKRFNEAFWTAVGQKNHVAALVCLDETVKLAKEGYEKEVLNYLEALSKRLLNNFVREKTSENIPRLVLHNLFSFSIKEALKLAEGTGTKADKRRLQDLFWRAKKTFDTHGM